MNYMTNLDMKLTRLSPAPMFILFVIIIMVLPAQLRSTTWIINSSGGGDFTEISAAISNGSVQNGDTLSVQPSTYTGNFTVNKDLAIIGVDSSTVIINANNSNRGIYINTNSVEIAHVTIRGARREGIYFSSTSRNCAAIIRNNIIKENDEGIELYNVNGNVNISNNVIGTGSDQLDFAIKLYGRSGTSAKARIINNVINLGTIPRDERYGIFAYRFATITVSDNSVNLSRPDATLFYLGKADSLFINNNTTTSDVKRSILARYIYDYLYVTDNDLTRSDIGFHHYNGNNNVKVVLDNNDFSGTHRLGLYIHRADSVTLTNNYFNSAAGSQQSQYSAYVRYNSNLTFTGNTLGPNNRSKYGLYAYNGQTASISNNTQVGVAYIGIYLRNIRRSALISNNSADSCSIGFYQSGRYVTDYTVTGNDFSDCTRYGIYIQRGDTVSVTNNEAAAPANGRQSSRSIYISRSNDLVLSGNTCGTNNGSREAIYLKYGIAASITDNVINPGSKKGIFLYYFTGDITIEGNQAPGNTDYGCQIYNSARTSDVTIHNNDFSESLTYGIYVYKADSVTITNNLAQASLGGSQTEKSIYVKHTNSHVQIANNTVGTHSTTAGDYAIYLNNLPSAIVSDNTVEGPNDKVIYVSNINTRLEVYRNYARDFNYGLYNTSGGSARKVIVKQNLFAGQRSASRGVEIKHGDSLIFINNTLTANDRGLYYRSLKALIKNNIVTDNNIGLYRSSSSPKSYSLAYNNVWNNSSEDYHNLIAGVTDISVDPLFVNSTDDFHLQSTAGSYHGGAWTADANDSPCIDAGDPADDFSNESDYNGNRINQGAYGNTAAASRSVRASVTYECQDFPRNTWVFWGVPLQPDNGDPQELVGDDFGGTPPNGLNWRVVRWNTTDEGYAFYSEDGEGEQALPGQEPPDFVPGFGYWLIQDVFELPTIDVTGLPQIPGTADTVQITAPSGGSNGLNMIANPFYKTIDWSDTRVTDGTQTKTILEAANANWIRAYGYSWNHIVSEYEIISPDEAVSSDSIRIWEGFWINQLDQTRNLELIFPYPSTPKKPARRLPFVDLNGNTIPVHRLNKRDLFSDWAMDLYLITNDGNYRDIDNRIGVSENATDGPNDGIDADFLPPFASKYGAMYFINEGSNLNYDFRSNEWEQQLWEFEVRESKLAETWNIRWPNVNNVPGNILLSLTAADTNDVYIGDLRNEYEYTFSLAGDSVRNFIIKATAIEDTVVPSVVAGLVQNPIMENYIDLYAFPSEPLIDMTVRINEEHYFPEFSETNDNIFRTSFELGDFGLATIIFNSEDLSGNSSEDTLQFNFQSVLLVKRILAPDGKVELTEIPSALDNEQVVGLGIGCNRTPFSRVNEKVGATYTVFAPPIRDGELYKLVFHLPEFSVIADEYSQMSIYRETLQGYEIRPAVINKLTGTLTASINYSGRYGLLKDGGNLTEELVIPQKTQLHASYPNPFNANTVIPYSIVRAGKVRVSVYDMLGREIIRLKDEHQQPGRYKVIWRGRNRFGQPVSSGVYIVQLVSGKVRHSQKIVMVK